MSWYSTTSLRLRALHNDFPVGNPPNDCVVDGSPGVLSHTTVVSRWLVLPTAAISWWLTSPFA